MRCTTRKSATDWQTSKTKVKDKDQDCNFDLETKTTAHVKTLCFKNAKKSGDSHPYAREISKLTTIFRRNGVALCVSQLNGRFTVVAV